MPFTIFKLMQVLWEDIMRKRMYFMRKECCLEQRTRGKNVGVEDRIGGIPKRAFRDKRSEEGQRRASVERRCPLLPLKP